MAIVCAPNYCDYRKRFFATFASFCMRSFVRSFAHSQSILIADNVALIHPPKIYCMCVPPRVVLCCCCVEWSVLYSLLFISSMKIDLTGRMSFFGSWIVDISYRFGLLSMCVRNFPLLWGRLCVHVWCVCVFYFCRSSIQHKFVCSMYGTFCCAYKFRLTFFHEAAEKKIACHGLSICLSSSIVMQRQQRQNFVISLDRRLLGRAGTVAIPGNLR